MNAQNPYLDDTKRQYYKAHFADVHSHIQLKEKYGGHWYAQDDSKAYPSVTTILNVIAKPQLMAWAKKVAKARFMEIVQGFDSVENAFEDAINHHKQVAEIAAALGHKVHAALEDYFANGVYPYDSDDTDIAKHVDSALNFLDQNDITAITPEMRIFNAPTALMPGYGGTIDLVGWDHKNNGLCIVDWKTGNGLYDTYEMQIAAYYAALCRHVQFTDDMVVSVHVHNTFKNMSITLSRSEIVERYKHFLAAAQLWQATHKTRIYE